MNLAIKGHSTQGSEIIARLKMLGGMNTFNLNGSETNCYYYIDNNNRIYHCLGIDPRNYIYYTFEEFLEKFPYKVGDTVLYKPDNTPDFIIKMFWKNDKVLYELSDKINLEACSTSYTIIPDVDVVKLQPYKEETLEVTEEFYNKHCVNCGSQRCTHNGEWLKECEHYKEETTNKAIFEGNAQSCDIMNNIIKENMKEIKIDIPKGYEFFGIDDDNKIVLTEKQPQYPKTYEECAKILNCFGAVNIDGYKGELLDKLQELLICRDAYWKIAGEQMGLSKPWESDFTNDDEERYGIYTSANKVKKDFYGGGDINTILTFPTEEMRDAFYNNFKDLIDQCKELL